MSAAYHRAATLFHHVAKYSWLNATRGICHQSRVLCGLIANSVARRLAIRFIEISICCISWSYHTVPSCRKRFVAGEPGAAARVLILHVESTIIVEYFDISMPDTPRLYRMVKIIRWLIAVLERTMKGVDSR